MSNLPFQQDTQSVIASVGPSRGALALKSPSVEPPTPEYMVKVTWTRPGLLAGVK